MTAAANPAQWLARHAADRPAAIALVTGDVTLTYGDWHARSRALAGLLTQAGFAPGVPTAVLSASRHYHVAWLTAGWQAGLPLLPLATRRPDQRELLRRAGVAQVVADEDATLFGDLPAVATRLADRALPDHAPPGAAPGVADLSGPLLSIASSGTSGPAKLAVFDAVRIAAATRATCQRLDVRPADCWLACLPMQHIGGLAAVLRALHTGAATVIVPRFDPDAISAAFAAHDITHVSLVPAMLAGLLDAGVRPPASLRCALIGGGGLAGVLHARAVAHGWPVRVSYGMTETFGAVAIGADDPGHWRPGDVGTPVGDVTFDIEAMTDGDDIGRIRISGAQVMCGYAGGAAQGLSDGTFVSSDLGRIDAGGHLHVLGRADAAFTSGGLLIQPDRIELQLGGCPGIGASVVVGVADDRWEHRIVAVYAGDADEAFVARWCAENLPSAERPREVFRWPELPLAGPGKPDRQAVQRRLSRMPGGRL